MCQYLYSRKLYGQLGIILVGRIESPCPISYKENYFKINHGKRNKLIIMKRIIMNITLSLDP